jgi:3-phosphoshikimate 1-carboxyvinyltransferase
MALPAAAKNSLVKVEKLVSKPYIDLTISILGEFGIEIVNENYSIFKIPGNQKYQSGEFTVEGDWSGAAFLMVMGAIGGEIEIYGLDSASTQADKAIFYALSLAGANVRQGAYSIIVSGGNLKGFEFDISDCPDLAPPLAALALACEGKTVISGTQRLLSKESNRSEALQQTLLSLGARIDCFENRMEIEGGHRLNGGTVDSYNDHRIAMTLAVAALLSEGPVIINKMESINKSYPGFVKDFSMLGGNIRTI